MYDDEYVKPQYTSLVLLVKWGAFIRYLEYIGVDVEATSQADLEVMFDEYLEITE